MLLSVFGRFRTVLKQTVTTPKVPTSRPVTRHLKLLSRVAIVGGSFLVALEDFLTDQARIYAIYEQISAATPPTRPMLTWKAIKNKALDKNMANLVKETCPAVVFIERSDDLGNRWAGSGFFINKEGSILTNAHVVGDNKTVTVLTTDDRSHLGVVERSDRNIDLALVRIQADTTTTKEFPSIRLGDSSKMRRNDFVMAIGYPGDGEYKSSLMTGVISSGPLSSNIMTYKLNTREVPRPRLFPRGIKVIRSNILGYPGASGAPLINQNGEAVGVLSSAYHNYDDERYDNLTSETLSVPSNTAKKFLAEDEMKTRRYFFLKL